jgi:predicted ATP-binding protein involved in virulence
MRITKIEFNGFEPIQDGAVMEFPKSTEPTLAEVQFLTGENGTGKTRILSLLAAIFGDATELSLRVGYQVGLSRNEIISEVHGLDSKRTRIHHGKISNFATAYRHVNSTSNTPLKPMSSCLFQNDQYLRFAKSPQFEVACEQRMVNQLVKTGIALNSGDTEARSYVVSVKLGDVISHITGKKFRFTLKESPNDHVLLEVSWGGKRMGFAQVPDGLRAIFKLLMILDDRLKDTQKDIFEEPFVLLLDEPETHLHPKWQRLLLPAVQQLFPKAQIFCATHSPFVISSVNSGFVHILRYDENDKVVIDKPQPCGHGDTYQDAVAEVLGLDGFMEYDPETERLLREFEKKRKSVITEVDIEELRKSAIELAKRSRRLEFLMGQQMHQLEVQFRPKEVRKYAEAVAPGTA